MFSSLLKTDQTGRRWLHPETELTQLKRCSAHKATPFPDSPVSFFDRSIDYREGGSCMLDINSVPAYDINSIRK